MKDALQSQGEEHKFIVDIIGQGFVLQNVENKNGSSKAYFATLPRKPDRKRWHLTGLRRSLDGRASS
jgi:hypothetical protein